MSETDLLQRLKQKDPDAFRALVELYQNRVIKTCYRFLHNQDDAEDVAQDVFIEVYLSISGFREEAKLSTWIYRIATTKCLDFIRKKKRKKRFFIKKDSSGLTPPIELVPAEASTQPDKQIEAQERVGILQQAVDSLAENQKIAITLSKYEGFSNKEIAEVMETSLSSVESLIHRAKKNLEKKLYRYFEKRL